MYTWIDGNVIARQRASEMTREPREPIVLSTPKRAIKRLVDKVDTFITRFEQNFAQPVLIPAECVLTPTKC